MVRRTGRGNGGRGVVARVDVGAQIVTRNAGGLLDFQDVFGGESPHAPDPIANRWLRNPDETRKRGLRLQA